MSNMVFDWLCFYCGVGVFQAHRFFVWGNFTSSFGNYGVDSMFWAKLRTECFKNPIPGKCFRNDPVRDQVYLMFPLQFSRIARFQPLSYHELVEDYNPKGKSEE